jgi:hypothetical protein
MRTVVRFLAAAAVAGAASLPVITHASDATSPAGGLTCTPAGLTVDAAGNGVLEVGEDVIVTPGWHNDGLLSIANLVGSTLSFTGPAGATYSMPDPLAVYGLVVLPGEDTWCTNNCYGLRVDAAVRPAVHWDAIAHESTLPVVATKDWVLHVGNSFQDVPSSSAYYRFVETILHKNVTGGCANAQYCPAASTTREQMAVFALVSKEGTGFTPAACTATTLFSDVPASSPYCRWIEELARRTVVTGCGGGKFCPTAAVTREQMAVFMLRTLDSTLDPPACGATTLYTDVPASSAYCRWIEELTRRHVVTGCAAAEYCPAQAVTREQMAVFLSATFSLTLYGV